MHPNHDGPSPFNCNATPTDRPCRAPHSSHRCHHKNSPSLFLNPAHPGYGRPHVSGRRNKPPASLHASWPAILGNAAQPTTKAKALDLKVFFCLDIKRESSCLKLNTHSGATSSEMAYLAWQPTHNRPQPTFYFRSSTTSVALHQCSSCIGVDLRSSASRVCRSRRSVSAQ